MSLQTKVFNSVKSVGYTLRLTVTENSVNISENKSNVNYQLELLSTTAKFSDFRIGWKIALGGTVVSETARSSAPQKSIGNNSSITIASGTANIAHDADGKKTMAVAFSIDMSKTSYTPGAMSVTGESMILTVIPRATTPSITGNAVIGQSVAINLPRAANSFTHTLKYAFGTLNGTIGTDYGSSAQWVIPTSFANQIPSAVSGTGSIICDTYSGTTLIGSKTIKFTAEVASTAVPSISNVAISETVSGIAEQFGGYLQNRSKIRVITSSEGAMGSTIKSVEVTVDSIKYNGGNIVSDIIKSSGNINIAVKVTDTRGRSCQRTDRINVIPYNIPTLTSAAAFRALSDGSEDEQGAYLSVDIDYIISSVNELNSALMLIQYRKLGDVSFSIAAQKTDYEFSGNIVSTEEVLDPDEFYEIRILLQDFFGNVYYSLPNVPSAFTLIDYHNSGKGISFGRVCKGEGMHIHLPIDFYGVPQVDFVCDEGEIQEQNGKGTWHYRKWNSGIAECWGKMITPALSLDSYWQGYYFANVGTYIFPPNFFIHQPVLTIQGNIAGFHGHLLFDQGDSQCTETGNIRILTNNNGISVDERNINITAKGKWK